MLSNEGKQQERQKIKQKLEILQAMTKPAPPQMQSSKYLEYLAAVDIANPSEFLDFLDATQTQPSATLPECIPIGSHYGVPYFIKSYHIAIPRESRSASRRPSVEEDVFAGTRPTDDDNSSGTGTPPPLLRIDLGTPPSLSMADSLVGPPPLQNAELYSGMFWFIARNVLSGAPITTDLLYGFGLGRLYHQMPDELEPYDTGFYVICNAVDKSIWVAFDFMPDGETGEIDEVRPEYGDPYGELPEDQDESMIGIQKLFSGDWTEKEPLSLNHGDPFTNGAGKPLAAKLSVTPMYSHDVVVAVDAGGAKQGVKSGFAAKSSF